MAKLIVEQKTILELFSDKNADFLIPDYQRPYAWEKEECQTLWDDIFAFAFPDNDCTKFDSSKEYFLGPIVTFKNSNGKKEIIDGQQRLTTLLLLLRAFYAKFEYMKDLNSITTRKKIEGCIWKSNDFDEPYMDQLKIDSEVASDNDKEEFLRILKEGTVGDKDKSKYAKNYQFFQEKIKEFLDQYPTYFAHLPTRVLKYCILLPIEAENQEAALTIFSTLNNRGMPLSDADIFKSEMYKYYKEKGEKEDFIKRWKKLEEKCNYLFRQTSDTTPVDEIFSRYMYYLRAKTKNTSSTTEGLRSFYSQNSYERLRNDEALNKLEILADFWEDVFKQNDERFSDRILRRLFVLHYAPNSMWKYFVSVYFLHNKDKNNSLEEEPFYQFLSKAIAYIWAYALTNPGVNALRKPIYNEMVNIVNNKEVTFNENKIDKNTYINLFNNYNFYNQRPITKSMITWWAMQDDNQELPIIDTKFETEHIFPKNRQEHEKSLSNPNYIELLGNKVLLEKSVNIRATDYKFADKKKYYLGFTTNSGKEKNGTKVIEVINMAKNMNDFNETNILERNNKILNEFVKYLEENNVIK